MKLDALTALRNTRGNPNKRFPDQEDPRYQDDLLFPSLEPKFSLDAPAKVFTIGSCFARNIEFALAEYDIELPATDFAVPKSEWEFRPNGILNEYNPGTTAQRILSAVKDEDDSEETIIETKGGFFDLLLPGGFPVSFERAVERRAQIKEVYRNLVSSDLVIVTLGLVEAWYDEKTEMYLNRMPMPLIRKQPDRYTFRRMEVEDSFSILDKAVAELTGAGVGKILFTVSPVPLGTTFTGKDVVVANSFSKAALRVCAQKLMEKYPQVDYYPSFELVSSGGLDSFNEDNIHVKPPIVRRATGHMLEAYFPNMAPKPRAGQQAASLDART